MTSFFDTGEESNKSLIGELFGDNKKRSKTTFDDLLSNISSNPDHGKSSTKSGKSKQKLVFQDEDLNISLPPKETIANFGTALDSSNLLDDLFKTNVNKSNKLTKNVNFSDTADSMSISNISQKNESRKQMSMQKSTIMSMPEVDSEHVQRLEQTISSLKKEISTLKYEIENSNDEVEEWKVKYEQLQKKYSKDISELKESHDKEIEEIKNEHKKDLQHQLEVMEKQAQIEALKETDNDNFNDIKSQLEKTYFTIDNLKNELNFVTNSFKEYQEQTKHILNEQITLQQEQYIEENKNRINDKQSIESLQRNLKTLYEDQKNIIKIERARLEEDKQKLKLDIQHFQKSKLEILDKIESQKIELERLKTNFLTKQHDLLVRVMNERAFIEEESQKFQMQKSMDISRIRLEAETLEKYAREIENARIYLEEARIKYEQKNQKLNEIEKILLTECVKLEKIKIKMGDTNLDDEFRSVASFDNEFF
uniref:TACC_C domain-containing protein n=1 Tax=Parastrongyloides trichosuri TaxID=131310 RepID=A0A0N5A0F5_PARTI